MNSIALKEVQKREDTKKTKTNEEDDDDEEGEDEDGDDVEVVAALQTASSSGVRRRLANLHNDVYYFCQRGTRRRSRCRVVALQTDSRQENADIQDDVNFLDEIEDNFGAYMFACFVRILIEQKAIDAPIHTSNGQQAP